MPRWSVPDAGSGSAASTAALPAPRAWVRVKPPLSASASRPAGVFHLSPVPVKPAEPSSLRL